MKYIEILIMSNRLLGTILIDSRKYFGHKISGDFAYLFTVHTVQETYCAKLQKEE